MKEAERGTIRDSNKRIIEKFVVGLRREELAKETIINYISYRTRMATHLHNYGIDEGDKFIALIPETFIICSVL